jgi:hypothetical protein
LLFEPQFVHLLRFGTYFEPKVAAVGTRAAARCVDVDRVLFNVKVVGLEACSVLNGFLLVGALLLHGAYYVEWFGFWVDLIRQ